MKVSFLQFVIQRRVVSLQCLALFCVCLMVFHCSNEKPYTMQDYVAECEQALGKIPTFSCMQGKEIPVTMHGKTLQNPDADAKCDKPSLAMLSLGIPGACLAHSRIGYLKGEKDTEWVFLCRRMKKASGSQDKDFGEVAFIGHRPSTGTTCFFQGAELKGGSVPKPGGSPKQPDKYWFHPAKTSSLRCIHCHDNDPWVHTPYVDQVKRQASKKSVPLVPFAKPEGKYRVVGSRYFTKGATSSQLSADGEWGLFRVLYSGDVQGKWLEPWPQPKYLRHPDAQACTQCHRIADQNTCKEWATASFEKSTHFGSWTFAPWMPPVRGKAPQEAQKKALEAIKVCCKDRSLQSCNWTPIPQ